MKLYLVRHGESESNRRGYFAGQLDAPLTELGHRQAECVSTFFRDIAVDAVYSSSLSRAMDTARPTAEMLGLSVIPEPGMREVFAGEWEGLPFSELESKSPEQYKVWNTDIGYVCVPGGETVKEAALRAQASLIKIAEARPQETVVVAAHGGIIRALLALWEHGDVSAMQHGAWAPNASVSEIEYIDGTFRVVRSGMVERFGDLVTELPKTI